MGLESQVTCCRDFLFIMRNFTEAIKVNNKNDHAINILLLSNIEYSLKQLTSMISNKQNLFQIESRPKHENMSCVFKR